MSQSLCVQEYKPCGCLATINQWFKMGGRANQVMDFTEPLELTEASGLENSFSRKTKHNHICVGRLCEAQTNV